MLRFPAALWILVFHLNGRVPSPVGQTSAWLNNGPFAIAFFFVLSGAMLAFGYRDLSLNQFEIRQFYVARFARIFPVYLVIHCLALVWFTPATRGFVVWFYVNLLSAAGVHAWFLHALVYGVNGGTWSISAELFFYAMFPPLLAAMRTQPYGAKRRRLFLFGWAATALAGISSQVFDSELLYYTLPAVRLPEFILGMLVGLELTREPASGGGNAWRLLVAAGCALIVSLIPIVQVSYWTPANGIIVPVFAWLIYAAARFEQSTSPAFFLRPMWRGFIYLGETAYCIFLGHLIPMLFLDSARGKMWSAAFVQSHGPGVAWAVILAGCLLGAVCLHEAVEKPARRALLRRWKAPQPALKTI